MPKIWQNLKNITHWVTHSPTWIQEMLAHLKTTLYNFISHFDFYITHVCVLMQFYFQTKILHGYFCSALKSHLVFTSRFKLYITDIWNARLWVKFCSVPSLCASRPGKVDGFSICWSSGSFSCACLDYFCTWKLSRTDHMGERFPPGGLLQCTM